MLGKLDLRTPPGSRPRDGRHCDLCGCSQPAVRCDKCGCQIFCLSCDDMYHRHPKRRFHLRKAVDPTPAVLQARPVLPLKVAHLNPGDPSKMPLPPPRKKKASLFSSFRRPSPSAENGPSIPKKEYSWTDRLGGIKKFMSNRPLPPVPAADDNQGDVQPTTNGHFNARGDLSFINKRSDERPPLLPSRSPKPVDHPQMQNGNFQTQPNHMNQNREELGNENMWNNQMQHQNGHPAFGTLNRQPQGGFVPHGGHDFSSSMHQSTSASDLQGLHNPDQMPGGPPPHLHFPHYPMNPHMPPPHYPYPMFPPQYPANYPQYFGNSFANLSNVPTSEGDMSDQPEELSRHKSKHPFKRRAKRSQSVMMDRMAYQGQFFPFGPYPGYGPWGAPMPMEAQSSPASSIRSLNRVGRSRRRKKVTSEDDDEFSLSSSPLSRPKSSSSDRLLDRRDLPRQAPMATSSEDISDDDDYRRNKINTIQRRSSDSKAQSSPATDRKRPPKLKKRTSSKQSDSDHDSQAQLGRRTSKDSISDKSPQKQPLPSSWECKHCTFINPFSSRICQVCCKTVTPRSESPVTTASRPSSRAEACNNRRQTTEVDPGNEQTGKVRNGDSSKQDKQEMAILNSALDEAEKEISRGLEELMKLKEDLDDNAPQGSTTEKGIEPEPSEPSKPVYKSSGRMRTSILDKLTVNKPQASTSSMATSTEVQTGNDGRTTDRLISPRRLSNSSTASEAYNSPLAQSPELGFSKQKRDSSCQTQVEDSLAEYLERKRAAEESFSGRPINNFGYGDRLDMVSPVSGVYERYLGNGLGMMQRSHSRASLFTGRMNELGPVDYCGAGYGFGATPMYRSLSRGSLLGEYPDIRMSEFHNLRKPDYYLSMEELVERRRQENMRAQGLELVRMIREAEQQGFTADDIQVALTHCGKMNPLEWLQDNWRNMLDSVVTLSMNYGNDKSENDIGIVSEMEAREALRMHKGNIWAAVTECVEARQRKFLELSGRGKFSSNDVVDALNGCEGDVEMAYAKLSKTSEKPFLMRIWGSGEGIQNQDGSHPVPERTQTLPEVYQKDEYASDEPSEELWSEDGVEAEWDEDDKGEDLQTCHEDLQTSPYEMQTPESDRSDYTDAFPQDRNLSSPSDDIFYVIPETKQEKKLGFLSKLAALRKDSKEKVEPLPDSEQSFEKLDDVSVSGPSKPGGALKTLKNTFSVIKDTVTGSKTDKKVPCGQPEKRTIIVRGHLEHEPLERDGGVKLTSMKPLKDEFFDESATEDFADASEGRKGDEDEVGDKVVSANHAGGKEKPCAANLVEAFQEPTKQSKQGNKQNQSLAERLKFAKKVYTSRTNLNSVRNDNSIPSTSKTDSLPIASESASSHERSFSEWSGGKEAEEAENKNSNPVPATKDINYKKAESLNMSESSSVYNIGSFDKNGKKEQKVELPNTIVHDKDKNTVVVPKAANDNELTDKAVVCENQINNTLNESANVKPSDPPLENKTADETGAAGEAKIGLRVAEGQTHPEEPEHSSSKSNEKDLNKNVNDSSETDIKVTDTPKLYSSLAEMTEELSKDKLRDAENVNEEAGSSLSNTLESSPAENGEKSQLHSLTVKSDDSVQRDGVQVLMQQTLDSKPNHSSSVQRSNDLNDVEKEMENLKSGDISKGESSRTVSSITYEIVTDKSLENDVKTKLKQGEVNLNSSFQEVDKNLDNGINNVQVLADFESQNVQPDETTSDTATKEKSENVLEAPTKAETAESNSTKEQEKSKNIDTASPDRPTDLSSEIPRDSIEAKKPDVSPDDDNAKKLISQEQKIISGDLVNRSSQESPKTGNIKDVQADSKQDSTLSVSTEGKKAAKLKPKTGKIKKLKSQNKETTELSEISSTAKKDLTTPSSPNASAEPKAFKTSEEMKVNEKVLASSLESENSSPIIEPAGKETVETSTSETAIVDIKGDRVTKALSENKLSNELLQNQTNDSSSILASHKDATEDNRSAVKGTSDATSFFTSADQSKTDSVRELRDVINAGKAPDSKTNTKVTDNEKDISLKVETGPSTAASNAKPLKLIPTVSNTSTKMEKQDAVYSKEFPPEKASKTTNLNFVNKSDDEKPSRTTNSTPTSDLPKSPATAAAVPEPTRRHSNSTEDTTAATIVEQSDQVSGGKESENDGDLKAVDSDDSDISDVSRLGSVTPPSPVDALRNRFEGLTGVLGVPGRPQSPFRRMSLNSRKQVIALEKIRDASGDKPWFKQKVAEPVKLPIPKRTIKQQLEIERRVRKMVNDRKCGTYRKAEIVVQLLDLRFEEEEAIQAANECSSLEKAISYLQQECQLCAGHYPASQIVSMIHCEHRACRECIRAYFTVQIRDRTILDLLCPFCNQPDIGDEDIAQDYFNHLDIMLKKIVDENIHELFQRKLRDRVLIKDPNFRWCSQCSSGFIAMPNLKRLVCPDCNAVTCASCRRLWERDHQGISCEAFANLKDTSDIESQAAGLAKILQEDGIDCPRCHFRYALAKGGCMHFRCIQCQHDFCSGCSRPFKMGQRCGVSEFCGKLGLHAHHPRNCLFYLRDKDPEDLQKLLDMNDIKYDKDPPEGVGRSNACPVMEQKETANGMVDDHCGKEVQDGFAGLCRLHYVEYLGQLVNKHKMDPIQIFDNDDLELVLRRANIRLPPKRYRESDAQYRDKLVKLIEDELPLDKMDGS